MIFHFCYSYFNIFSNSGSNSDSDRSVSSNSDITISELDETEIPFRTPYEWLNETNNDNEATVTNSQLSDINDVRTLRSSINKNSIEWCTNDVTSDDVVNNLNIGDFYVSTDFS